MLKTEIQNPLGHGLIGVRPFEGDGSSMGPRTAELEALKTRQGPPLITMS